MFVFKGERFFVYHRAWSHTRSGSMKKTLIGSLCAVAAVGLGTGCSTKTGTGAAAGAGTGAVVAGPPGAAVGAATGAAIGASQDARDNRRTTTTRSTSGTR